MHVSHARVSTKRAATLSLRNFPQRADRKQEGQFYDLWISGREAQPT